jgi:hypothetical protein
MKMSDMQLEAVHLRTCWMVKPLNQLGTCGFYPAAWSAYPVPFRYARTEAHAVAYARRKLKQDGR